jgi:hypothetical protein
VAEDETVLERRSDGWGPQHRLVEAQSRDALRDDDELCKRTAGARRIGVRL